jgi:glycosyltransferase involved in cell wall biosynthesis
MNVLHIDTGRQMRGGQRQALWLAAGLRDAGVNAVLVVPIGSPLWQQAQAQGLDTRPLDWRHLAPLARQSDLVHAHDAAAHTLAALFCRTPLVVSRRVAFPPRTGLLSKWKYSRPARYLAVSHFVRGVLIQAGVRPEKIAVVYDGVPPADVSTLDGPIIAPATSDPAKGSALLRKAAAVAGLEVLFSSNLLEDLRRASLFVYLSFSEGLGSAALAAMAAGVPVIASRVGGLPEIVRDQVTGLLVDNDPAAVAGAMRRLWDDPPLRARMGEAGRQWVQERFSVHEMVHATLKVYREVVSC